MSNQIVKTASYTLSPDFNIANNMGVSLIKVGVPSSVEQTASSLIMNLVKDANIFILNTALTNVEYGNDIIAWVEVELLCNPTASEEVSLDAFGQIDLLTARAASDLPYTVSELNIVDYPATGKVYFRSTDNREKTGDLDLYHPDDGILFTGVLNHTVLNPDDLIRVITVHTSKYTPIVNSFMSVEMVQPRQAPVVQFSPYMNQETQVSSFVFGQTGAEVIEELNTPNLVTDTVSVEVISHLVAQTTYRQYQIALVLNAWRKVYSDLNTAVITSIITNTIYYDEIINVLESGYAPSVETLHELFIKTPVKPANWNMG